MGRAALPQGTRIWALQVKIVTAHSSIAVGTAALRSLSWQTRTTSLGVVETAAFMFSQLLQ